MALEGMIFFFRLVLWRRHRGRCRPGCTCCDFAAHVSPHHGLSRHGASPIDRQRRRVAADGACEQAPPLGSDADNKVVAATVAFQSHVMRAVQDLNTPTGTHYFLSIPPTLFFTPHGLTMIPLFNVYVNILVLDHLDFFFFYLSFPFLSAGLVAVICEMAFE